MLKLRARVLPVVTALLVCGVAYAGHDDHDDYDYHDGHDEHHGHYKQHNLTSNRVEIPADHVDPFLINAWGLAFNPTQISPHIWWAASNGNGIADPLSPDGTPGHFNVLIPGHAGPASPTGAAANLTDEFVVSDGVHSGPAGILFASEDGTIAGMATLLIVTEAFVVVDNAASGAIYKGLALAFADCGEPRLYATDFHNNKVDVFDGKFAPVDLPGAFTDPDLPRRYAPFGIHEIDNHLFVTYAKQDAAAVDDDPGPGRGFVDEYDADGNLLRRVASRGALNSPWGVALAPGNFGPFSHDLLIGNFGDGAINAYEPKRHHHRVRFELEGPLTDECDNPVLIDGLWSIEFGQGDDFSGPANTLFFTAGPNQEQDGLFGSIRFVHHRSR